MTFVLRALGYSSDSDFAWNAAWELTDELGITNGEYDASSDFTRGDAVIVSANALDVTLKDGSKTLLEAIKENLAATPTENGFEIVGELVIAMGSVWIWTDLTTVTIDGVTREVLGGKIFITSPDWQMEDDLFIDGDVSYFNNEVRVTGTLRYKYFEAQDEGIIILDATTIELVG